VALQNPCEEQELMMKMMHLGVDGPEVSRLGLGCMRMSGPLASRNDAESVATIMGALDAGLNFLDTGDYYGAGHNETLVSQVIRHRREKAFLSVKFGGMRSASGAYQGIDVRPAAVKNFAVYSLQRLGVDVIDLYQPGRLDPDVPVEDTVGAVADLIAEGKVRYLGLSEANTQQLRAAQRVHPVTALQIEYSLATRFIEPEILPAARELGVGIVADGITGHGLLTGALTADPTLSDQRGRSPRLQGDNLVRNLEKVDLLREIAGGTGCSLTQLALAWVLSRGQDILALVGMSRRARIAENLEALDIVLTDSTLAEGHCIRTRRHRRGPLPRRIDAPVSSLALTVVGQAIVVTVVVKLSYQKPYEVALRRAAEHHTPHQSPAAGALSSGA
jgi:aryl-alcohol dehydrogenase-like predicted oxidoreductase